MSDMKIEPIRDGRFVIDGIVYTLSVIEVIQSHDPENVGNRDVSMACTRCDARWSMRVTRAELTSFYDRVPPRSSPMTILHRAPQVKRAVSEWSAGHMCMPRGYVSIPSNVLQRLDRGATKAEQYETLATVLSELAIAEGA